MANSIPYNTALEYLRDALEEKIKEVERDVVHFRMEIGKQIQDVRRDNRQIAEKQFEFEKTATKERSLFEKSIDKRIGQMEEILLRLDKIIKWFVGVGLTIAGAVALAQVLKLLGL